MSILFKVPLEDHPRMCGEQNQLLMDQVPIPGSPPRVRGTDSVAQAWVLSERITPACAGNRSASAVKEAEEKDHPRVCGEQFLHQLTPSGFLDHPRVCGEQGMT